MQGRQKGGVPVHEDLLDLTGRSKDAKERWDNLFLSASPWLILTNLGLKSRWRSSEVLSSFPMRNSQWVNKFKSSHVQQPPSKVSATNLYHPPCDFPWHESPASSWWPFCRRRLIVPAMVHAHRYAAPNFEMSHSFLSSLNVGPPGRLFISSQLSLIVHALDCMD